MMKSLLPPQYPSASNTYQLMYKQQMDQSALYSNPQSALYSNPLINTTNRSPINNVPHHNLQAGSPPFSVAQPQPTPAQLHQQQPNRFERMDRKIKKPLMEKKRRARINQSLAEIKQLLMQASPHQRSKLEKADILEMTVEYLRGLALKKPTTSDEDRHNCFLAGYRQCASTVLRLADHPSPNSQSTICSKPELQYRLTSELAQLNQAHFYATKANKQMVTPQRQTLSVCIPNSLTPDNHAQATNQDDGLISKLDINSAPMSAGSGKKCENQSAFSPVSSEGASSNMSSLGSPKSSSNSNTNELWRPISFH